MDLSADRNYAPHDQRMAPRLAPVRVEADSICARDRGVDNRVTPFSEKHCLVGSGRLDADARSAVSAQSGRGDRVFERRITARVSAQHFENGIWNHAKAGPAEREHRPPVPEYDRGTHVGQRALPGAQRVGVARPRLEPGHAVTKHQSEPVHHHARAERITMGQRERHEIAASVGNAEMHGAVSGSAAGLRDYLRAFPYSFVHADGVSFRVCFREQLVERNFDVQRVTKKPQAVVPRETQRLEPRMQVVSRTSLETFPSQRTQNSKRLQHARAPGRKRRGPNAVATPGEFQRRRFTRAIVTEIPLG